MCNSCSLPYGLGWIFEAKEHRISTVISHKAREAVYPDRFKPAPAVSNGLKARLLVFEMLDPNTPISQIQKAHSGVMFTVSVSILQP